MDNKNLNNDLNVVLLKSSIELSFELQEKLQKLIVMSSKLSDYPTDFHDRMKEKYINRLSYFKGKEFVDKIKLELFEGNK